MGIREALFRSLSQMKKGFHANPRSTGLRYLNLFNISFIISGNFANYRRTLMLKKENNKEFTQKDLLLHLLSVSQHSATREEMEKKFDNIDVKFDKIDDKFDKIDDKFDKVDKKFEKLDQKIDSVAEKLTDKIDSNLKWLLVTFISVAAVIVAGVKYLP